MSKVGHLISTEYTLVCIEFGPSFAGPAAKLDAKLYQIQSLPLTLFTANAFVLSRLVNHFRRLKISSDKDSWIALLLIEAARSGVGDTNLYDVVTDYSTH